MDAREFKFFYISLSLSLSLKDNRSLIGYLSYHHHQRRDLILIQHILLSLFRFKKKKIFRADNNLSPRYIEANQPDIVTSHHQLIKTRENSIENLGFFFSFFLLFDRAAESLIKYLYLPSIVSSM